MVDPVTWGGIGLAASAMGGTASTVGAIAGGYSKSQQFQYQSAVAGINETLAKQNADYTRAAGEVEAGQYGQKARQLSGKIVAAQGASGFDVNRGSATDVQDSQHLVALQDLRTIRNNAARKAYGYDVEASKFSAEKSMYDSAAKGAVTAGWIGGLGSFLGTASSVSSKWLQGNQVGLWGGGGNSDSLTGGAQLSYASNIYQD